MPTMRQRYCSQIRGVLNSTMLSVWKVVFGEAPPLQLPPVKNVSGGAFRWYRNLAAALPFKVCSAISAMTAPASFKIYNVAADGSIPIDRVGLSVKIGAVDRQ